MLATTASVSATTRSWVLLALLQGGAPCTPFNGRRVRKTKRRVWTAIWPPRSLSRLVAVMMILLALRTRINIGCGGYENGKREGDMGFIARRWPPNSLEIEEDIPRRDSNFFHPCFQIDIVYCIKGLLTVLHNLATPISWTPRSPAGSYQVFGNDLIAS